MPAGVYQHKSRPPLERFNEKWFPEPFSGCWLWTPNVNVLGYGQFYFNGKPASAHRVSWLLYRGEIPQDLCVLHRCDTPSCVNPDHLWLGTFQDNAQDCVRKKRWRCGDRKGNKNGASKLSPDDIVAIRLLYKRGHAPYKNEFGCDSLAKRFGVSQSMVHNIVSRKNWTHV